MLQWILGGRELHAITDVSENEYAAAVSEKT